LSFIPPISLEISKSPALSNQATGYFFLAISVPVSVILIVVVINLCFILTMISLVYISKTIVGPTLAGIVFERTNSYKIAYHAAGAICVIAGLILLVSFPKAFIQNYIRKVDTSLIGFFIFFFQI
jgi:hypothetical protein